MYFDTRELTLYLFLYILIWYLEPRVRVKYFSVNPLFTVIIQLPLPIGSATSPSGVPHPDDHRAVGITVIRRTMRLHASFPFLSLLPPCVAARLASFPTAINVVAIVILWVFWICPHHLDRSSFVFLGFFSLLYGFFCGCRYIFFCCLYYHCIWSLY